MTTGTVVAVMFLTAGVIFAVGSIIRQKKKAQIHGRCSGSCAGCMGCRAVQDAGFHELESEKTAEKQ